MSRWDTVCFDLDGTLVDTLEDLAHATEEVLMRNRLGRMDGKPVYPLDAYRQFVGSGARKLIERAAGEFVGKELVDHLLQEFLAVYDRDCLMYSHPYEEIPALLGSLQDRGIKLLVVTNKPETQAKKIVRHYFGEGIFARVYGGVKGRKVKPDPETVLTALKEVGTTPDHALYMGDSDVDVFTAHNAGMVCAGAAWGFRGEEELMKSGADILLRHPLELMDYMG